MLDLSRDYLVIDDPITVLYRTKTGPDRHATGVSVPYCQRLQETAATVEPGSDLRQRTTVFHLFRTPMAAAGLTATPKRGDLLEYGGREYLVQTVQDMDRDAQGVQRYRLTVGEAS